MSSDEGVGVGSLDGRRVAVVGLGVSNVAVVRWLAERGALVTAFDMRDAPQLAPQLREVGHLLQDCHCGGRYLDRLAEGTFSALVLTPGLDKRVDAVELHRRRGALITSETDLFFRSCSCRTAGVTGSAGKTTTTTLLHRMLESGLDQRVHLGGNIGIPLVERATSMAPDDWAVLELSSFQLETCSVAPHVAVLLNIYSDHLDVHRDATAYAEAKARIIRLQRADDLHILNYDQPEVRALGAESEGSTWYFSLCAVPPRGIFVERGRVRWTDGLAVSDVGSVCDLRVRGRHNLANFMAAAAAALLIGVKAATIMEVARDFTGIEHRLEVVAEVDGVLYVNDSIATTPERALAALDSFDQPLIVIAGGSDKGLALDEFARHLARRARGVVLLGAMADPIERAMRQVQPGPDSVIRVDSLAAAIAAARGLAEAGEVVLLSPACASFDMFDSYVQRGDQFRSLVLQLAGERES